MAKKIPTSDVPSTSIEWFTASPASGIPFMREALIFSQAEMTCQSRKNLLQEIEPGIFCLSIASFKHSSPIDYKKISDRAQYSLLPQKFNNEPVIKLSFNQLKNLCHNEDICSWATSLPSFTYNDVAVQLIFFYHSLTIEAALNSALKNQHLFCVEKLSNKMFALSDGNFIYPYNLALLAALLLWKNTSSLEIIHNQVLAIKARFSLFPEIVAALKTHFRTIKWQLYNNQLIYTIDGLTKSFDYASLADDIIAYKSNDSVAAYISGFNIHDLDCSTAFPTVSVRSLIHLKARPNGLSSVENGYAVIAAKENSGKQTPLNFEGQSALCFNRWLARSARHLARHTYQARVIFSSEPHCEAIALVGEQVASLAIFPKLIKGVLEQLNIPYQKSVRLIAHNEDVLTIAFENATWSEINQLNRNAETLFKMVATDGADPISLFEQKLLPAHGVGTFHLSKVPGEFFELIETAHLMKQSMPPGHDSYLIGLAYECLHEWGLAVEQFQKALRQDSHDPDILSALGSALLEVGHAQEAMPFIKRAFDLLPDDPEVANNFGRTNLECGLVNEAIGAFERAVKLSPGSANFLANLGNGYLLAARLEDALAALNKAVRCNPSFAPAHESLAYLYLHSGDELQAKKHALLAYKENPVDPNIANLLWRLTVGKKESTKS